MKTYKQLYAAVTDFENLYLAFRKAARGKRKKGDVARFEYDLEDNLLLLQEELLGGQYQPGKYFNFRITDPKPRLISAAPFRDRVVHHALCQVIEPIHIDLKELPFRRDVCLIKKAHILIRHRLAPLLATISTM